jgi:arylsulfatase A-like enzyme
MRRHLLAAALLISCLAGVAPAADAPRKPNIIVILTDDLGYADLSCYGNPKIRTPSLDRMAAEGAKFTDFYAAACVCTPTRAALMTGCYAKRVGMHVGVLPPRAQRGLHPDEVTLAEVLRGQGYATACIGKWHLGEARNLLPTAQGFDAYFGMAGPNHGASDLYRGTEVIEQQGRIELADLTQRYTREAVAFIRKAGETPFFLYLAHGAPHIPLYASDGFKGKSAAGMYGDMIEEIDWSVGQVLEAVRAAELDARTIVIFTSDNGPSGVAAPPLHGGKGSTWEAGLRVPCLVRWPGKVPPGAVCREMAVIFDWMPTLARLAGGAPPAGRVLDGKDIGPLVLGQPGAKSPHEHFVYYSREGHASAIRAGEWKLHVVAPVERWAGKQPVEEALLDRKPVDPLPWLFNLGKDIGETRNVAREHPEIVARLSQALKAQDEALEKEARPVFKAAEEPPPAQKDTQKKKE